MRRRTQTVGWSLGLFCLLCGAIIWSVSTGSVSVPLVDVAKAILNWVALPVPSVGPSTGTPLIRQGSMALDIQYVHPFSFPIPESRQIIVTEIRLPRIALAAIVGFALSLAGAVMQGFFRNPMADPSIIGVSSGAAVGAVAVLVFSVTAPFGLQLIAFLTALLTALVVYLIATKDGRTPVATLLLAGVAVQSFLGAVISYALLQAGESINTVLNWLMGNLSGATWGDVWLTLLVSLSSFLVLAFFARDLNVLLLGETQAQTLGIDVEWTKRVLLGVSSLLTAAAVAVAGVIGFVGLIVPHMLRLLVGPDHRILLPTSALGGAVFLVLTDTLARSGPAQLPVGIVTAVFGAPFFLYLLRKREVHRL